MPGPGKTLVGMNTCWSSRTIPLKFSENPLLGFILDSAILCMRMAFCFFPTKWLFYPLHYLAHLPCSMACEAFYAKTHALFFSFPSLISLSPLSKSQPFYNQMPKGFKNTNERAYKNSSQTPMDFHLKVRI